MEKEKSVIINSNKCWDERNNQSLRKQRVATATKSGKIRLKQLAPTRFCWLKAYRSSLLVGSERIPNKYSQYESWKNDTFFNTGHLRSLKLFYTNRSLLSNWLVIQTISWETYINSTNTLYFTDTHNPYKIQCNKLYF